MKIRIGNDIRLKVQLTFGENTDKLNILAVKAVVINTTLKKKLEEEFKKKHRFFGRFPIEPFVDEFEPSEYNIHSGGFPKYRAIIPNPYHGFGVYPNWKDAFPVKDMNITEYRAEVQHTPDRDTIIVTFPAEAQLYPGSYELLIIAKVFDPGYKNNTRTICTNYSDFFELVATSEEADVDQTAQIEIVNNDPESHEDSDVYVVAGFYNNDSIGLERTDGGVVHVDVSPITDWYESNN